MDKNLTIRILGAGPTFEVTAETDNSSAKGTITLPPELINLANLTHGDATFRSARKESAPAAPPPNVRALGIQLFQLLFAGDIRDLLTQALATAERGVRIRLNITASDEAAALAAMPWEILTPTGVDDAPLAFGRKTVLVRSIDVTDESVPLAFEPPLRILFVVSNPTGSPPLKLTAERDRIVAAFGGEPRGVSFGATVRGTRDAIADALASANPRYHVVHFMGHGDFDPETGRGAVLLEKEDGSPDRVDGQQLRYLLERSRPQLVFLNACKTATTGTSTATGVAHSLSLPS